MASMIDALSSGLAKGYGGVGVVGQVGGEVFGLYPASAI